MISTRHEKSSHKSDTKKKIYMMYWWFVSICCMMYVIDCSVLCVSRCVCVCVSVSIYRSWSIRWCVINCTVLCVCRSVSVATVFCFITPVCRVDIMLLCDVRDRLFCAAWVCRMTRVCPWCLLQKEKKTNQHNFHNGLSQRHEWVVKSIATHENKNGFSHTHQFQTLLSRPE